MILPLGANYRGVSICVTMRVACCPDGCAALCAACLVWVLTARDRVASVRVIVV